jgi:hypothetical protein
MAKKKLNKAQMRDAARRKVEKKIAKKKQDKKNVFGNKSYSGKY